MRELTQRVKSNTGLAVGYWCTTLIHTEELDLISRRWFAFDLEIDLVIIIAQSRNVSQSRLDIVVWTDASAATHLKLLTLRIVTFLTYFQLLRIRSVWFHARVILEVS